MRFLLRRLRGPATRGCVLVFIVALVPRLIGVGQFLTADEKNWTGRGWEFARAMHEFRFNDTLQTTHPGIPTLWLAGGTSAITSRLLGIPFGFERIRTFVAAAQVPMAVANSLLIAGIFLAARTLLPHPLALLAGLTVASDPFLIAHGKLVHVDALLAGTTSLALLLLIGSEQLRRRAVADPHAPQTASFWKSSARLRVGSAILGGLALLAKVPGAIVLPMAALTFLLSRTWRTTHEELRTGIRMLFQWLVILSATVLVLWPGLLWVPDPLGNLKTVKRDLAVALSTPHHMADEYQLAPWHYPATLLSRSTIPTLMGFLLFLGFAGSVLWRYARTRNARRRNAPPTPSSVHTSLMPQPRVAWLLLAFVVLFAVGMTIGAKKGDRYFLPVFPVFDLLAVCGMAVAVARLRPQWTLPTVVRVAAVLLLVPLMFEAVRLGPYALAHYNRLFPPNFSQELGWGEGLDQVAEYLNSLDDGGRVAVASWYPEELRALVRRPVDSLGTHTHIRTGYVVLYRNMFGRAPSHPANDFLDEYYRRKTPVFTARVNGLEYAWVYRRPVYDGIVGELVPGRRVTADIPVSGKTVDGVEVYLATYSGRAVSGSLVLRVRTTADGPDLRVVRQPIRPDDDNTWVRFTFPPLALPESSRRIIALVEAEGTARGNAPTIRFAPREKDAPRYSIVVAERDGGFAERPGSGQIGIRVSDGNHS